MLVLAIIFVGNGDLDSLPTTVRERIDSAVRIAAWVPLRTVASDPRTIRISDPAIDGFTMDAALFECDSLAYLAPGYGRDDDPIAGQLAELANQAGAAVDWFEREAPSAIGVTVFGPASPMWRPDPAKATYVRGIVDAMTFQAWSGRLRRAYGPDAPIDHRAWDTDHWLPAPVPFPARFPVTLRASPTAASRDRATDTFLDVIERLRGPDGCPWDKAQTHESLRPYMVEEAQEAVAAIESGDATSLGGELGDVALQVALHAEIGRQGGRFDWGDVMGHITAKLIRRHPHVFGDVVAPDAATVLRNWEQIKSAERGDREYPMDELPMNLPALVLARKVIVRARRAGIELNLPIDAGSTLAAAVDGAGRIDARALGLAVMTLIAEVDRRGEDLEIVVRDAARRVAEHIRTQAMTSV